MTEFYWLRYLFLALLVLVTVGLAASQYFARRGK